jgi:hypothetical protein
MGLPPRKFALHSAWSQVFRGDMTNAKCTAANKFSTISLMGGRDIGERAGTRTRDHLIKSQVLYHLSYAPFSFAHDLIQPCFARRSGLREGGKPVGDHALSAGLRALLCPVNRRISPVS